MDWTTLSALLAGAVLAAVLPRAAISSGAVAVMRIGAAATVGVLCLGVADLQTSFERSSADYDRLVTQYRIERRIALAEFVELIGSSSRSAGDSPLETVYIGCQDCTEIGDIVEAFNEAGKGSADFRVEWIASAAGTLQEVRAAVDAHRWLGCHVLSEDAQVELRMNLRGSLFMYEDGTVLLSSVDSVYPKLQFSGPPLAQDEEHPLYHASLQEGAAELAEARKQEFLRAIERAVPCAEWESAGAVADTAG